jgi:hypothetical protein
MKYLNTFNNGKYNGYGNEYHIGQTTWYPRTSQFTFENDFALAEVSNTAGAEMLVIPQFGSGGVAEKKSGNVIFRYFTALVKKHIMWTWLIQKMVLLALLLHHQVSGLN